MTVYIGCIHARRFTPFHTHMTVFYSFLPTTVHTGAPAHDGLGRAALVRRFKSLKPSHKALLAENWQNWQTGRTPSRFVSTPPRPIHQWKALGAAVTTVILHGGVLYYNLSYGGYTPKSQLAAINPLFLPETLMYVCCICGHIK